VTSLAKSSEKRRDSGCCAVDEAQQASRSDDINVMSFAHLRGSGDINFRQMIMAPMATGAGVNMTSATIAPFCQCSAEGGCTSYQRRRRYRSRRAQRVGRCHSIGKIIRIEMWRQYMLLDHGRSAGSVLGPNLVPAIRSGPNTEPAERHIPSRSNVTWSSHDGCTECAV
jgi:hypothetical protein